MPYSKERQREYDKARGRHGNTRKIDVFCACGGVVEPFSTDLVACTACATEYLIVRRAHKAQLFPVKPYDDGNDDAWIQEVEQLLSEPS